MEISGIRFSQFVPFRVLFPMLAGLLLALGALTPVELQAQSTASLTGVVRDTTGAIIPGATVVLTNEASKAVRKTTSNGEAFFSFAAVQPATYSVTVSEKGFESWKVTGLQLDPSDSRTINNIALKIGRVDQEMVVSATVAGVSLSSPEKSALITAEDIQRLSTVGRDVSELVKVLPGFAISTGGGLSNGSPNQNAQTMGFGSSSISSFSANGSTPQTGATTVVSDGASVMDPGDMGASITNINTEMVQEVKVSTSNFGADSAKGPVVVSAVTKSGGSDFHGAAYIYARNYVLNSNDWISNHLDEGRPEAEYYYPGGNIGGPIKIPGTNFNHSKKLTFWNGFEYYKQKTLDTQAASFIPTPAMLAGDLSAASINTALNINDSATQCSAFYTSGTIPNAGGFCYSPQATYTVQGRALDGQTNPIGILNPDEIDPTAAIYAKFWPKPNRAPQPTPTMESDAFNYVKDITGTHDGLQYHARVDQNFSDNTKFYVTYNYEKINDETAVDNTYYAGSDIIPYPTPDFSHSHAHALTLNLTHVFSPSMTNELIGAAAYFYEPTQLQNRDLVSDASTGWPYQRYYNNGALQLPNIVDYENGVPDFAMGYFSKAGIYYRKYSYNVADNLTKQYKSMSLKFGVYAEVSANNQVPIEVAHGLNTFNHYNAGCNTYLTSTGTSFQDNYSQLHNNIANFLQGCTGFSQANSAPPADLNFKTLDFFATDEWKVTRKLTLTLGIRFEHLGPWVDAHGKGLAVWNDPGRYKGFNNAINPNDPTTWAGISWHATNKAVPVSGSPSRALFYSPRVGLAYDIYGNGKSTLRGGWGAYRFHDSYNDSAGALNTTLGVNTYSVPANFSCTYAQIQNSNGSAPSVLGNPTEGHGVYGPGQSCSSSSSTYSPFTIYALDPHDDQQPVTYNYNMTVDQILPHNMAFEIGYVGNQSSNIFTEGNLRNQNYIPLGSLFHPDPITGVVTVPDSQQTVVADFRPYPNYLQVLVPNHIAYGNYNALQASINRTKGAFIFGLNYTWSKAMGVRGDYRTGTIGDPSSLRNNYGILGFNRDHIVNITYSYQEGKLFKVNNFIGAAINGWEVSGITGIQSGPDIAVLTSTNFGLSGGVSYTPPGSAAVIQQSLDSNSILGTPDITLQPTVLCDPKSNLKTISSGGQTSKQFINGACFGLPAPGTNGTWELPNVHGPAYFNSDLTLAKNFKVTDKQNIQFRLAGFNFLNHPLWQMQGPGSIVGLSLSYGLPTGVTATSLQQAYAASKLLNGDTFGYTNYKTGNRIVELGVKYNF